METIAFENAMLCSMFPCDANMLHVHWGFGIPFQELSKVGNHIGKHVSHLEENFEIDVEEEGK